MSPAPSPLRNITIDNSDSSLKYSQGWQRSTSGGAIGGDFAFTTGESDSVLFSLPANAVAVYYYGFKQPKGALYGACLDCDAQGAGTLDTIDAHDQSAQTQLSSVLLYSEENLDPTVSHTLSLLNFPDTRFGNVSTMSVDAFFVSVIDTDAVTTSTISSVAASMTSTKSGEGLQLKPLTPSTTISSSSSTSSPTHSSTATSSSPSLSTQDLTSTSALLTPSPDPSAQSASSQAPFLPPSSSSSSPSPSPSLSPSPSPSPSPLSRPVNSSANNLTAKNIGKLSSPAILVGILLATLLVSATLILAFMSYLRRRRRRAKRPFIPLNNPTPESFTAGSSTTSRKSSPAKPQLPQVPQMVQTAQRPGLGPTGARPGLRAPVENPFLTAELDARRTQSANDPAPRSITPPTYTTRQLQQMYRDHRLDVVDGRGGVPAPENPFNTAEVEARRQRPHEQQPASIQPLVSRPSNASTFSNYSVQTARNAAPEPNPLRVTGVEAQQQYAQWATHHGADISGQGISPSEWSQYTQTPNHYSPTNGPDIQPPVPEYQPRQGENWKLV